MKAFSQLSVCLPSASHLFEIRLPLFRIAKALRFWDSLKNLVLAWNFVEILHRPLKVTLFDVISMNKGERGVLVKQTCLLEKAN